MIHYPTSLRDKYPNILRNQTLFKRAFKTKVISLTLEIFELKGQLQIKEEGEDKFSK
jgi:hypothetical protein